jgi:3-oxoacyl-[acyl-carrier-protein] synthase II
MASLPVITQAEVACALGNDLESCLTRLDRRQSGLKPLGEFFNAPSEFDSLLGGWIPDRSLLLGRRYGAASNLAVRVSQAVTRKAGWTTSDLRDAWVFVGSSRGNAGELLNAYPKRRPIKRFRASNLMHSEIAAAVSIELGIRGPWQVLSNGCAASLDALGWACLALHSDVRKALVVAVDLPLIPELLVAFRASGVLSSNNVNDPYAATSTGFLPGEAAVALTLERSPVSKGWCAVEGYSATSDAFDSIGLPEDGRGMVDCMRAAIEKSQPISAVCPHATGTRTHARAEIAALGTVFGETTSTPCVLLKPYTGHTLGASGLLDVALTAAFLQRHLLPPNLPELQAGSPALPLPASPVPMSPNAALLKLSVGMGGHNAALILRALTA